MKRPKLEVEKRELLGKPIKKLRRQGILPANIYGKDIESTAVQVPLKTFQAIYKEVGSSGLLDIVLDGQTRPVLIHNVQLNYSTRTPLHADFFQVNMKEKVKTTVPLVTVGEAKAVSEKVGVMMQTVTDIEVEALPEDLPENIEVNVEHLAAIGDQILISDLKAPNGVEILSESSQVAVKIDDIVSEEAKEQASEEAAAATEASEEAAESDKADAAAATDNAKEAADEKKD